MRKEKIKQPNQKKKKKIKDRRPKLTFI